MFSETNLPKKKKKKKRDDSFFKIIIITIILLVGIILLAVLAGSSKQEDKSYTLSLKGDNSVVVYKGSSYVDPGAKAVDSDNVDISSQIIVDNDVNVNVTGRYEITYTLGDISVKRVIRVIERPVDAPSTTPGDRPTVTKGETTLTLNGEETVYIAVGGTYKEDGYIATDTKDGNISKKVEVTHNVNNKVPGNYQIVYTVKNSSGVVTSIKRNLIVLKVGLTLGVDNKNYTKNSVGIKVLVEDEDFDYLLLPNGNKVTSKTYTYRVNENGEYTFKSYNKHGIVKQSKIKINNIDKQAPIVSCSADYKNGQMVITINAKDDVGIASYVANDRHYAVNQIIQNSFVSNNVVGAYDVAGNYTTATCDVAPRVYIDSVNKDGVIITVNARKVGREITGYYFSYNNTRPNKSTGGYVATNRESIDVVRLPGTTYVWVEDNNGNVSEASTISIGNDAIPITTSSTYKTLKNMSLETFLANQGWSKAELDKLIARSVRAAGVYSKESAATAGVALQLTLAQKYKIKLPYWWGGKSWEYGTTASWGSYKEKYSEKYDKWYYYYGFDCSGFVTWAYRNAGYNIQRGQYPSYSGSGQYARSFTRENGEIGDFIGTPGHVKMIIGHTDDGFICAEASQGVNTIIHKYSKKSGAYIVKGEMIAAKYPKDPLASIPTGF